MALYGTFSNTSKVFEQAQVYVSNATVTYSYLTQRTLDAGTWLIHVSYSPSENSGDYPGSDIDDYDIGIDVGGTIVVSEIGYESQTPYTNNRPCSLVYVHQSTSSTTARIGYRQGPGEGGNGDSGGMAGRLTYQMYRISDYA